MKQYAVLDPSLMQVSQGDSIFPVNDGIITLPVEIAHDLVQSGQLTLASNVVTKAAAEPGTTDTTTNNGAGNDGDSTNDGTAGNSGNSGDDEATEASGEQA